MRRASALQPLSRQHHEGLVVAQRLRRATADEAVAAAGLFLEFFRREGGVHFRLEEEFLLPAYARYAAADDPDVVRVLTDHVDIRRRAADVRAGGSQAVEGLRELGERLEAHIRHEERVLFPRIEEALGEHELAELAEALEREPRRDD